MLLWTCCLTAQAQAANAIYLGYCDGQVNTTGTGKSGACTVSAAICLPKEKLALYKGCEISQIRVGLANWYSELHPDTITAWIRTSLDSTNRTEGQTTELVYGWNTVVLGEACPITGEEDLYIGFSYRQEHSFNCISMIGTSVSGGSWIAKDDVWTDFSAKNFGNLSIEAVVTGEKLQAPDFSLLSCQTNRISVKHGEAILISGCVLNNSAQAVEGFSFHYKLDDEMEGDTVIARHMDYRDTCNVVLCLPTHRLRNEERMIKAQLSLLTYQGDEDSNMSDNKAEFRLAMYDQSFYRRNILLEQFTTEKCYYCPSGGQRIKEGLAMGYDDRVAWVCHHVGFGQDVFTINESKEYLDFYGDVKNQFAPAYMLNRHYNAQASEHGFPVQGVGDAVDVAATLDFELLDPAFVRLDVQASQADGKINIHVEGTRSALLPYIADDPRLSVFVKESNIDPVSQTGAYEGFVHNNVLRAVPTAAWGDAIAWNGDDFSADYSVKPDAEWQLDSVQVVAFVANYSDDIMNRVVYNVAQTPFGSLTGVTEVAARPLETRYYNLQGMPVRPRDARGGVYIRQTRFANGKTSTEKVIL